MMSGSCSIRMLSTVNEVCPVICLLKIFPNSLHITLHTYKGIFMRCSLGMRFVDPKCRGPDRMFLFRQASISNLHMLQSSIIMLER